MWNSNLGISILVSELIVNFEQLIELNKDSKNQFLFTKDFSSLLEKIGNMFPDLSDSDRVKVLQLCFELYNYQNKPSMELVITAPHSFRLKARKTLPVIYELIKNAEKSIIITGYSISDYAGELLQLLIDKSRKGVQVQLFVNSLSNTKNTLQDLLLYKSKFLQIYNYQNKDDKMASLHAKIITVDTEKILITSSNLSYHGIIKNIEIGILFDSQKRAFEIGEIFRELKKQKILIKV